jgi:hypothetical protein
MCEKLLKRIQRVIAEKCGKNETAFAKKIDVAQSTINRTLKSEDYDRLMGLTGFILLAFPEISRTWLLVGEGEMYDLVDPRIHELEAEVRAEQAEKQKLKDRLLDVHGSYWELNEEFRMFRKQLPGGHPENPPTSSSGDVPTQADAADLSAQSSE